MSQSITAETGLEDRLSRSRFAAVAAAAVVVAVAADSAAAAVLLQSASFAWLRDSSRSPSPPLQER